MLLVLAAPAGKIRSVANIKHYQKQQPMTAIRTYEVLCSWIESATTQDHLKCVDNYIKNVFTAMYPMSIHQPIYEEMVTEMYRKIEVKSGEIITID